MGEPQSSTGPSPEAVATKAVVRAGQHLGLSQADLADILHVSPATVSRMVNGQTALGLMGAEGQCALLFLRVFRSLDTLMGGRTDRARAWFHADNHHLGGVPAQVVRRIEGLARVAEYLDAMRGQL